MVEALLLEKINPNENNIGKIKIKVVDNFRGELKKDEIVEFQVKTSDSFPEKFKKEVKTNEKL